MSFSTESAISVVGGGSWGTALAKHLAQKGFSVTLWVREDEVRRAIVEERENKVYLPGIRLPDNVHPTCELGKAVAGREVLIFSIPSQYLRGVLEEAAEHIDSHSIIINTSKGFELITKRRLSEVFSEVLTPSVMSRFAVLSGPSFALEVAQNKPTAVSVASQNLRVARYVQNLFSNQYFRVYATEDVVGVEICGAMKNVIAIAAGIVDGLGLGHNSKAALITRGLAEISRLGIRMGANPHTFSGLAGVGDLLLTSTGALSRNRQVGVRIGSGESLDNILSTMTMVAEGVKTSLAAVEISKEMGVEMPITEQVVSVLYSAKPPEKAIYELMTRELKHEME
ncbi:MAG: NAD(P)H-dependent glycerol-3-phosphate dehydrogenase [Candidatus Caldarchaeum sp.]